MNTTSSLVQNCDGSPNTAVLIDTIVRSGFARPADQPGLDPLEIGERDREREALARPHQRRGRAHDVVGDEVDGADLVVGAPPAPVVDLLGDFVECIRVAHRANPRCVVDTSGKATVTGRDGSVNAEGGTGDGRAAE